MNNAKVYGIQSVIGRWWPKLNSIPEWTVFIRDAELSRDKSRMESLLAGLKAEKRAGAEYAKVVELCGQPD